MIASLAEATATVIVVDAIHTMVDVLVQKASTADDLFEIADSRKQIVACVAGLGTDFAKEETPLNYAAVAA